MDALQPTGAPLHGPEAAPGLLPPDRGAGISRPTSKTLGWVPDGRWLLLLAILVGSGTTAPAREPAPPTAPGPSLVDLTGFPPLEAWPMEPWTLRTDVLDSELEDELTPASLVGFPEDGTEWTDGVFGRALVFDGVSRHVDHEVDWPRTAGTLGHWLRPDSSTGLRVAFYTSDFAGGPTPDYNGFGSLDPVLEIHTGVWDGEYFAIWQDGPVGTVRQVRGGSALADTWSQVTLTWSVPGQLTLYVDCVAVATAPMDASFEGRTATDRFLGQPSQPAGRSWQGDVDELKLWEEEFSASDVRDYFCPSVHEEDAVVRAPLPAASDLFGFAAVMEGDWLLVRSPGSSEVHWYRREGTTGLAFHSSAGSQIPAGFLLQRGRSVDLSGSLSALAGDGEVDVMRLGQAAPDQWGLVRSLPREFDDFGDFGISVALAGDELAVGSSRGDGGAVYLYQRDEGGTDNWGRTLYRPTSTIGRFGRLVDLDGDLLAVVGSNLNDFVQVFARDLGGPGAWGLEAQILASSSEILSMALRGDRLALSSLGNNGRGVIAVHRRDLGGPGAWGVEHYFLASDRDWNDELGTELTWLDDETLAATAGASPKDHQAVYVFGLRGPQIQTEWSLLLPGVADPISENSASFGRALAGVADLVVVAAPFTGSTLAGTPVHPVDSGRLHVFVNPAIFVDGFETGDSSAWSSP